MRSSGGDLSMGVAGNVEDVFATGRSNDRFGSELTHTRTIELAAPLLRASPRRNRFYSQHWALRSGTSASAVAA
jgi:hypothetical protein